MNKDLILNYLDEKETDLVEIADKIWSFAEISHQEFKSSRVQAAWLEAQGFDIEWGTGGLKTAFTATWGTGKPILGFLGEFDALQGLSQKKATKQEPLEEGKPGHGCGHNLLGTAAVGSVAALKAWMEANDVNATIRYYGCPAEENTYGKTFMAREGVFDDLDAGFNFHPSYVNYASKSSAVGVTDIRFRFHGKTAHAGGSPHLGRSALDAVELMNVGVNYLREHVTEKVRMHYVITHGGDLPNVVPADAEVWYFIRAHKPQEMQDVLNRVRKIAQGAALMTETKMVEDFRSACSAVLPNYTLADLHYENFKLVGETKFDEADYAAAKAINEEYPPENKAAFMQMAIDKLKNTAPEMQEILNKLDDADLVPAVLPPFDEGDIETGSTDVGDVSQITPLCMLQTACWPVGASGHSWGIVAASGMPMGFKGMMQAAKVMALSAADLLIKPEILEKARKEFEEKTSGNPYQCPLPDHVQPPVFEEK